MYAKILQDSVTISGKRIISLELEYPRFIHSEFLTHRVFSRNSASSRAIPGAAMEDFIRGNMAKPIHWGKNQPGMQAVEEIEDIERAESIWTNAFNKVVEFVQELREMGVHKQIVNRPLEPWCHIKTVVTSTEWDNFFELRLHPDAQPEFQALAKLIKKAIDDSEPQKLLWNEWHLPYIKTERIDEELVYLDEDGKKLSVEDAIKISVSCCAQVSYRKNDTSIEKALVLYKRLCEAKPFHASPFEHQATPIRPNHYQNGITHISQDASVWSGNFRGWIQFRKTVENRIG